MRIGEFVMLLHTTKDTVRHYEEIGLLLPSKKHRQKEYTDKEKQDFEVITELKASGLVLKDIKLLFDLKKAYGCGNHELLGQVVIELERHAEQLAEEEKAIVKRRKQLNGQISAVKKAMLDRT